MIEDLLPYYEKQLQEFGQQSRVFAEKYPKIAQRLSLNQEQIDDPHIERLIQSFSLIAARMDKKLADSYDMFTKSLFEIMFPQYLRHFPSCSIVSFEDKNKIKQLTEASEIPAKTLLKSRSLNGIQCEFITSTQVDLLPVQLNTIQFSTNPGQHRTAEHNATLTLGFELFNQPHIWLKEKKLPIYLDTISNFALHVLDGIFRTGTHFSLKIDHKIISIQNPFEVMGFSESESLLPVDQYTHHAYRLLMEYFCFPEKFNYINMNLDFLKNLPLGKSSFQIQIHLNLNLNDEAIVHSYSDLSTENFKLFTTPIVNLFEKKAEPQKINHKKLEYPLVTDVHHPECYKLYSVLNMTMIREKTNKNEVALPVLPFFALSHYADDGNQFFYTLNQKQSYGKKIENTYSIISKQLNPDEVRSDFMSATLLCSNGDLPHEVLVASNNIFNLNDTAIVRRAFALKRPSKTHHFQQTKQEQWRVISHLSLNMLAIMGDNATNQIKELLQLYNLPKTQDNFLLIDSIKSTEFKTTSRMMGENPFPIFVRGIKACITVDASVFRGHSLYIFSQLLSETFNLKVQMNSFVEVVVIDQNSSQELYQCIQSAGGKNLL